MSGVLYQNDCFKILPKIDDQSVDLILCDLPYNTTKAKWDKSLDLNLLWEHYKRIIKPNGAILLFAQTPFDKILGYSNLDWLKYEWIWEKTQATGWLNAKKMPMKAHENILVFYKNPPTYNPQKTTGHKPMHSYTKRPEVQNKTELYGAMNKVISGGGDTDRYPRSVLVFPSDKQRTKLDGTIHPTQKPLALCEYLIKTYTNEGDVVLDNTAGSGTTGLASKNLNRKYILIEMEEKWCQVIKKRIPDVIEQS
jgi:site-specific DNA-methyltransferase (adenine-specific)